MRLGGCAGAVRPGGKGQRLKLKRVVTAVQETLWCINNKFKKAVYDKAGEQGEQPAVAEEPTIMGYNVV